jgi:hypothetical protein
MSIRPVDLQILIPRTAEINRANEHNARQDLNGQSFSDTIKREANLDDSQVHDVNKSEQDKISKDGKNGGGQGSQRENEKGEDEDKKDGIKEAPKEMGMFDISI